MSSPKYEMMTMSAIEQADGMSKREGMVNMAHGADTDLMRITFPRDAASSLFPAHLQLL